MRLSRRFVLALIFVACVAGLAISFARIRTHLAASPALRVKAIARQWWWEFDYPSLGVRTSNVLYLPSGTDIQLELVSEDVIHSFWVQGMKDSVLIVPGRTQQLDVWVKSPGELDGSCDSSCGCAKTCMKFRVLARTSSEFQRWAAAARLHAADFKPPASAGTPACALNTGHDGHSAPSPASHLQQLLDGTEPASTRGHPVPARATR